LDDIKKSLKRWRDLAYNGHQMLRDYWTYEEIQTMPIRGLLDEIDYFTPKLKEIARRQEEERLKAELEGKRNMKRPGRNKR